MDIQVHNSAESLSVADGVFGTDFNEPLIHQVVTAYMAGGRAGTKKQKTKAEVRGGGRKPWRQKGTGRARAGSIRSPIWRGGGRAHAAVPRDFSQKVNRKMYRGALRSIFSELVRSGNLLVTQDLALEAVKTKGLLAKLSELGVNDVLLVSGDVSKALYLSSRNLHKVGVCDVAGLNPVALLTHSKVVMTADAVKQVEAWLS